MSITAFVAAIVLSQAPVFTGTLADKVTPVNRIVTRFSASARTDIPGFEAGDTILMGRLTPFRPKTAPDGLQVILRLHGNTGYLFVDRNADGEITTADHVAEMGDTVGVTSWNFEWQLPAGSEGLLLPATVYITVNRSGTTPTWSLSFPESYRVEGAVVIDGRKTLVTLPFKPATGTIDVTSGYIGIDTDGDGHILNKSPSPEFVPAAGQPALFRLGSRYISVESADFKARSFTVRERPASEYTLIEVRQGSALDDFSFTDYEGKSRKLSEFRGKHVLLDFWGSWCKPCLDELPSLKDAYARYRDRGFEILGIDYEMGNTSEKVRSLLAEKQIAWINATPESVRSLVDDRFHINSFPTLILLDTNGVVIEAQSHELRGKRLLATLEKVFEKK